MKQKKTLKQRRNRIKKSKLNSRRSGDWEVHYDNVFNRHVNFKERVIYVNDDIDDNFVNIFQKAFDEFDLDPDKNRSIFLWWRSI